MYCFQRLVKLASIGVVVLNAWLSMLRGPELNWAHVAVSVSRLVLHRGAVASTSTTPSAISS
jgi:hypothetical protein